MTSRCVAELSLASCQAVTNDLTAVDQLLIKVDAPRRTFVMPSHRIVQLNFFYFFYRAMHFSAKRGIAIACRLSVRLSVCL